MNRYLYNLLDDIDSIDIDLDYYNLSDYSDQYNRLLRTSDDIYLIDKGFKVSNPTLSLTIWIGTDRNGSEWLADTSDDVIQFRRRIPKDGVLESGIELTRNEFEERF